MSANDFYLWLQLGGLSEEDLQALKCVYICMPIQLARGNKRIIIIL